MRLPNRREILVTAVFSLTMGLSAFAVVQAAPEASKGPSGAPVKSAEFSKAFPYLDKYLSLVQAERNHFVLAYAFTRDGKPLTGVKVWIQHGLERQAVPIGPNGRVGRLPTEAQIRAGDRIVFDVPSQTKLGIEMAPEPVATPSGEMSAPELSAAIAQAQAAVHRFAGVFGFAAPHIDRALFVGAAGARAVLADGRSPPLPISRAGPFYNPSVLKGVRSLRFDKPPSRVILAGG